MDGDEVLRRVIDAIEAEALDVGLNSDPINLRLSKSLERIAARLRGTLPSQLEGE